MSINCSLIIDSCCDLPRDVVDAEGVKIVSFCYNNESGSHTDDMYASLTAHDFYEAMRGGDEPSTSQVTLGEFLEVFKQACSRFRARFPVRIRQPASLLIRSSKSIPISSFMWSTPSSLRSLKGF